MDDMVPKQDRHEEEEMVVAEHGLLGFGREIKEVDFFPRGGGGGAATARRGDRDGDGGREEGGQGRGGMVNVSRRASSRHRARDLQSIEIDGS